MQLTLWFLQSERELIAALATTLVSLVLQAILQLKPSLCILRLAKVSVEVLLAC